jgi:hypothetical protein
VTTCPVGSYYADGTCLMDYEGARTLPDTVVTGGEYCYGNGDTIYDSYGRKIKNKSHKHSSCESHH